MILFKQLDNHEVLDRWSPCEETYLYSI